jgi:hypothetical protein
MNTLSLDQWNRLQLRVIRRYCGLHRLPLTADLVGYLAPRFARKHAALRAAPGA